MAAKPPPPLVGARPKAVQHVLPETKVQNEIIEAEVVDVEVLAELVEVGVGVEVAKAEAKVEDVIIHCDTVTYVSRNLAWRSYVGMS